MDFNSSDSSIVHLITEETTGDVTTRGWSVDWIEATKYVNGIGFSVTVLGFLLNYFCFLAAGCLPESSSATLIKYLAVWDSIASMQDGVLNLGMTLLDIDVASMHVSIFVRSCYSTSGICHLVPM